MTDRPIIFSAPMVRALLDGRKTQTRRLAWKRDAEGCDNATPWHDLYMEWQFRPIAGFFDYLAGRDGLIYSMKGGQPPKALKGTPSSKGYLTVSLCAKGGIKTKAVHRLIAEAWLGPCPVDGWEVRHLNGKRADNRIENLDWGSVAENWSDRRVLGNGIHEEHHAAKITMADAEAIRSSSLSQRKLAAQYGLAQSTIWEIKAGRAWTPAPAASGRNMALPPPINLWVRENWRTDARCDDERPLSIGAVEYEASERQFPEMPIGKLRPSIHMPRWASRITLTVTAVRVERLQEISEADAAAEGAYRLRASGRFTTAPGAQYFGDAHHTARAWFRDVWTSLHGADAWDANPEVVALSFTVARRNIDQPGD